MVESRLFSLLRIPIDGRLLLIRPFSSGSRLFGFSSSASVLFVTGLTARPNGEVFILDGCRFIELSFD